MSRSRFLSLLLCLAWPFTLGVPSCAPTAEAWTKSGLEEVATLDREIMIPMRDGVRLSTSLLIPKIPGAKMPAILVRTPMLAAPRADVMEALRSE